MTTPEPSEFDAVVRLAGLILSNASVYGLGHEVTRAVAARCYEELTAVLARHPRLDIRLHEGELRVNGVRVGQKNSLAYSLANHLLDRGIEGFALDKGITRGEFEERLRALDTGVDAAFAVSSLPQSDSPAGPDAPSVPTWRPDVPSPGPHPSRPAARPRPPETYYLTPQRKFLDFVLGFFGIPSILAALFTAMGAMLGDSDALWPVVLTVVPLCIVGAAVAVARARRRYIAIGFLSCAGLIVVIPLVLFGACILMFAKSGFN